MEGSESSSSIGVWILLGVAILAATAYLTGVVTLVAQGLGLGYSTRLTIDAEQAGRFGEFLLHLPPTDGDIVMRPEPSGALSLGDSSEQASRTLVGDDGAFTILGGFCSAGCLVALTNESGDDSVLFIEYVAKDSEYVDDIEVEYLTE